MTDKQIGPIQHKRGTTAKVATYTGLPGELVIDMEKKSIRIQDGITPGGHELDAGGNTLIAWEPAVTSNLGTHNELAYVSVLIRALSALGNDRVTYSVTAGTLPAGLSINAQTGMLTGNLGNLSATQTYSFTIRATDGFGTIERSFTLTVNAVNNSPVWVTASNLGTVVGAVNVQLQATDPDSSPLTYALTGGSLPQGLSLSSTGLITGTPTINGQTYNFTVSVSDSINIVQRTFSMTAGVAVGMAIDGDIVVGQLADGSWLLVAPAIKRAKKRWGLYGTDTTLPNIGSAAQADPNTGKYNTDVLVSATYANVNDGQGSIGAPAAKWCRDQGYDLPNKEELNLIYQNRAAIDAADTSGGAEKLSITGANAPRVWSSSENGGSAAWVHYFADGATGATSKSNEYLAVPVRRFNTI